METLGKFFETFGKHISVRVLLSIAVSAFTLYLFDLLPGYLSQNLRQYALALGIALFVGLVSFLILGILFELYEFWISPHVVAVRLKTLSNSELSLLHAFFLGENKRFAEMNYNYRLHCEVFMRKGIVEKITESDKRGVMRVELTEGAFHLLGKMSSEVFKKRFGYSTSKTDNFFF